MAAVAVLTLLSVAVYLREWVRHMGANGVAAAESAAKSLAAVLYVRR